MKTNPKKASTGINIKRTEGLSGEGYLRLRYVPLGIVLCYLGLVSMVEWMWPLTIGILAVFSGVLTLSYGLMAPSPENWKDPPEVVRKLNGALTKVSPVFVKILFGFFALVMFGGSAFFFYSLFFGFGLALSVFTLFMGTIMFISGCQFIYLVMETD